MITKLDIKNFTVFNGLTIDFSSKINVIIGENGTGKTHLLKAAYGLCSGSTLFKNKPDIGKDDIETALTSKLLQLFMPLDDKLGKLRRHGVAENAQLEAQFALDKKISVSFHTNSKSLAIQNSSNYEQYLSEPVYIPTKEVLSFMKGFNSLYEKYGLSFDQTYQDICLLLDLPEIRPETLHEKSKWAMTEIEGICGGRFVFYGGGKVTFKTENAEYSANSMAEGFRKAGMLSRLLETGAIQPGVSGPLFWDEPESNLNPKLMELLVQILLELSRNGQQIILATHDYVLLKWFDLLMDKSKDHVRYHALYRDIPSGEVKIGSTDDYREIERNPITEAFNHLTIAHAKSRLKGTESE
ncbi:AAA family ATPase [Geobacter benzoatilyticus]|uniref:AAA family ATPase n=1 Tax=Geobacter benzoatilyticus TaxID=2815309 RepID=A0ABX7Q0Q4_9BACT|nr:AAA family ATPase [Geobacter benzoatilyticus]QSV44983.1 AAA family ATPase [Geobacter benzoatilyticus]